MAEFDLRDHPCPGKIKKTAAERRKTAAALQRYKIMEEINNRTKAG
jgi:hypothetical protein